MKGPSGVFQVEGTAHARVQRQVGVWGVGRAERRPGWLEQGGMWQREKLAVGKGLEKGQGAIQGH